MSNYERVRDLIRHAIGGAEDNAARAASSFKGLDPEQMQEEHGQSGCSRAEVLEDYKIALSELKDSLEWFQKRVQP